ncbi:MAG: Glycerol-3-phosphate acyltransferase [Alphaproteobacteria bacterium MarineAlpha9_Bin4]|nr:acyl-phosphate glycerol 3-phosphate acyltransferase [Pelagibacterales bacterium]PPR26686.1 MAG: Glycerol-3-phosphate acyltransferase [Alphaproteobacteria bacterium MarineAlpha9_Bin4]
MENLIFNQQILILILVSYLVGSIPFGFLIFKFKNKDDIRKYGSGNIGATNVNRLLGKKLGLITLLLDFLKTFLISFLIFVMFGADAASISGFFSVIGHMFPIWLKFKGGKGVASFLGLLSIISWPLSLIFCIVWLIIVKYFKYSGTGAIISIILNFILFKLVLYIQFNYLKLLWIPGTPLDLNVILGLSIIILIKHSTNFKNLLKK